MRPTGIVKDSAYLMHDMGMYHPENPRRLEVIYELLDGGASQFNVVPIMARQADKDEIASNHSPAYVERIAATAGRNNTFLDMDTSANAHSWEAASRAVGGILNLVDAVMAGEVRNGFALVRPPGHHAEYNRAMGFCFFNNVAVAARQLISKHGLQRVAIVDWDLHHGNGTQHSFYNDPKVLFMSLHQYPHYPGTGSAMEAGAGEGLGHTLNIPMSAGLGDSEYLAAFHSLVAPVLEVYKPEFILVSAGFDAHHRDPLGSIGLTEDGYEQMTQLLMHLAAEFCSSRIVLTLEGGYDLQALRDSVARVLSVLSLYDPDSSEAPFQPSLDGIHPRAIKTMKDVHSIHSQYWPTLPTF